MASLVVLGEVLQKVVLEPGPPDLVLFIVLLLGPLHCSEAMNMLCF